ncbi:MAG TPA: VWA domain-containing protein [Pyrinomonadaceae bacterium]|nr:VWA domain-containing protein [Pyrinomonadaceae bacterium]
MFFKPSLAFALSLCLLLSATGQQAQPPAPQDVPDDEDDVVRITSNLVQMDAIVTDKQGRHVTDLRAEDFEIREDGRRRDITEFSYVSTVPATVAPAPNLAATPPADSKKAATTTATVAPVARVRALRPEQTRRTIVLAVDDLGLSSESFPYVKRALKQYVDEQMQPGDLVAVVGTSSGAGALQQLTADKQILHSVIDQLRWRARGRGLVPFFQSAGGVEPLTPGVTSGDTGREAGEDQLRKLGTGVGGAEQAEALREEAFVIGTLGALQYIAQGLRDLPGRKSVVLFSDGLSVYNLAEATRTNERGMSGRLVDGLRRLTDAASRASVVFYAVHARGLPTLGIDAKDDGLYIGGNNRSSTLRPVLTGNDPRIADRRASFREGQDGLVVLARETGGFAVLNNNDVGKGLARVIEDQQGFYLIGYRPDEKTFDPLTGRRRYRSLSIKVKRPGLTVRTRSGFYGFADAERPAAPPTRDQQLVKALTSPFTSGGVALRLTAFFGNEEPGGSFVRSMLHIDTRGLTFKEGADGWREAVIDVLAAVFHSDGTFAEQVNQTHTIRVRPEAFERSLRSGLVHTLNVPVKDAGAYQLRLAVRDAASERIGSAHQYVEVPDVGKGVLALSGLVAAAAQTNAAASTPGAPPVVNAATGAETETEAQASPAVRRFRPGMRMDFGYVIYNAKLDPANGKPRLTTQVSLFRDGRQVFAGTPEPFEVGQQTDLKRLVASGRLRLGADLGPGEYVLQAVVTDALAPERSRTAAQWLEFEIVR